MLHEHRAPLRDGSDLRNTNILIWLNPEIWSSDLVVEISRPQMETLDLVMVRMILVVLVIDRACSCSIWPTVILGVHAVRNTMTPYDGQHAP